MRVATKFAAGLKVCRADDDGDVYIGTTYGGFYIHRTDVPRLIAVLKWAIKSKEQPYE